MKWFEISGITPEWLCEQCEKEADEEWDAMVMDDGTINPAWPDNLP
jgi:hypothetical protein